MERPEGGTSQGGVENVPDRADVGPKQLGQLLIEAGILDQTQLSIALQQQRASGERLGEALLSSGVVNETQLVQALATQLGIEIFDPGGTVAVDPKVLLRIPENLARKHRVIAIREGWNSLTVAMADPLDLVAIDDIRIATGGELEVVVGRPSDIESAIATAYRMAMADQRLGEAIEGAKLELGIVGELDTEEFSEQELRSKAEDAPIVKLVDLILGQAIAERATDIHIEPLSDRVVVRYRVDGVLYDAIAPPKRFRDALVVRIKILSDMDVAERRIPLDGRFTARFEDREVDVRVSTLPTVYGEKVAMRLLDKSVFSARLSELGFEPEMLKDFRAALRKPYGMVLISGPTGSGKTTSLYAGIGELDRSSKNITALADPVEYYLDRVNQVSINPKAGLTFATGLRALLRQDPDIIMIGEVRDLETAELAVRSALTGHLVLSTVHANDAASTATRLVDIGIEPFLVTSAVHLVMAQRLVRKVCDACREPYQPDPTAIQALDGDSLQGVTFYRGSGCKRCKGRGYRGRVGVFELMRMTPEIAELVLARASTDAIKSKAIEQGLITLKEAATLKVRQGVTTVEEALSVCAET